MYLRQSTASQARIIGPFVDDTDFKTLETALTINNTDVKLMKNGGASGDKNSGGGTHRVNGDYSFTFNATDTDTVGELEVSIKVSGALVVKRRYWVLEEVVYDNLYAASAPGYIVPSDLAVIDSGTAQAGAAGSITLQAGLSVADDLIQGSTVHIVSGTGAKQSRVVHDWDNTTKIALISPNWTTNPDNTSVYKLIATPPASTASPADVNTVKFGGTTVTGKDIGAGVALDNDAITAAKIANDAITAAKIANSAIDANTFASGALGAVWDETLASHLSAGTTGSALNSASSAGDPWNTQLPGVYAAGSAGKIIGDRINATISSRAQPSDIPSAATIASTVWATVVEGSYTALQYMRGIASAAFGKASGLPTAPQYRDTLDTKARITAATDSNGNRNSVTLDLS